MSDTVTLSEQHWQAADAVARALVGEEVDINELKKATGYLRSVIKREDAGKKFFDYLTVLVNSGRQIGHSGRTPDYYKAIRRHCETHMRKFQAEPEILLQTLGWAARLGIYYKESPVGEQRQAPAPSGLPARAANTLKRAVPTETPLAPAKPAVTPPATPTIMLKVGQVVEATITKISGNEVSFEFSGMRRTQKEPKLVNKLNIGQLVKIEITELREDGSPKKFKLV